VSTLLTAFVMRLISLPRRVKLALQIAYDFAVCFSFGVAVPLVLASGDRAASDLAVAAATGAAVAVGFFVLVRLYAAVVRFIANRVSVTIGAGSLLATVAWILLLQRNGALVSPSGLIYWASTFAFMFGARALLRAVYRRSASSQSSSTRVVVYGAGIAGRQLVTALRSTGASLPVAFIDDDPSLQLREIEQLKVYGTDNLAAILQRLDVREVILALPSANKHRRQKVLEALSELRIRVRTVPSMADLLTGKAEVNDLRAIEANDVLGREPVSCDPVLVACGVRAKNVLVTGAGGSIGSELCRQIAVNGPKSLVMLDHSEHALFQIELELRSGADGRPVAIHAVLGSATNESLVREVLARHQIDVVFHAAAYKHVPLLEENPIEGLSNNIACTKALLDAVRESGVSAFTLVSTDKAVRPTNIMGASKRVAELMVQAAADSNRSIRMSIVRFGNVLGSSGSVLPIFQSQISAGGPVTLTHPDVTRYFMTIPEAAQLILQSLSLGHSGDVFHLDIGEPIRIADLARRLIRLNGLRERVDGRDGDIEIKLVGLRPGEKLTEELLISNDVTETSHPQIFRAREAFLPSAQLEPLIKELLTAIAARDQARARMLLAKAVENFSQSAPPHDDRRPNLRLVDTGGSKGAAAS